MTDVLSGPSAGAEMRYTWDWTPQEHRRMSRSLLRHSALGYCTYCMVAVGVAGLALTLWSAVHTGLVDWMLIVLLLISVTSFTYAIVWEIPVKSTRRQKELHSGRRWLAIDDEALRGGCDTCSMRIEWSKVRRAVEAREFIFLFVSANQALWMPTRVMDARDLARVRALIRDKLGTRAKLHAT